MQADSHPFRAWRKENGLSLAAVAAKAGTTASHLSEIERGLDRPSLRLAARLSGLTEGGVPIGAFDGPKRLADRSQREATP